MKMKAIKIKKIERIHFKGYLYDLTTLPNHNFLANGVIIHNCEGTPGKVLLETGKFINKEVNLDLKMFVKRLDFSSHLGRTDLFDFVEKVNPEKVFCVHGDHTEEFAAELKDKGFDATAPLANNRVFEI
jgi:putative mRNA 3-end processing factor